MWLNSGIHTYNTMQYIHVILSVLHHNNWLKRVVRTSKKSLEEYIGIFEERNRNGKMLKLSDNLKVFFK